MTNEKYILWQGDCLEEMNHVADHSVDMILCDLPYGQTQRNKWDVVIPLDALWKQYKRLLKEHGAIVLFGNGMFTAELMMSNKGMWKYNLIWEKTLPVGHLNAKKMPLRSHEDICVFYEKLPTYNPQKTQGHTRKVSTVEHGRNSKETTDYGEYHKVTYDSTERYPTSILTFAKDMQKSALHPTQKPVALLEYLIKTYTNEGDIVLDNCMGSGSTGVAALSVNRRFIGIEMDMEYFNAASKRIGELCNLTEGETNDKNN